MPIETDPMSWLTAAAVAIALLSGVLVTAVRTRKMQEELLELHALRGYVHEAQSDFAEIVRISERTFVGLRELSGFGLHFREIKREQLRLAESLKTISVSMQTLAGLLQSRGEIRREHEGQIKEIVEASRSLQEWRSRMVAVYSEAGDLLESEPIRELIEHIGPQHKPMAMPPGKSNARTEPRQNGVRRQRR